MLRSDPKSNARKPKDKRVLLGQVFTPIEIACNMFKKVINFGDKVIILDPSVGPATFPKALFEMGLFTDNVRMNVYDIDEEMIDITRRWNENKKLSINVNCSDYLMTPVDEKSDLAILNPPYIRQEWIAKKEIYQKLFKEMYGLKVPGTSNLYVYFLIKTIMDLKAGGKFACIVYDSWQSTKYGKWLLSFLNSTCDELEIEAVGNQPFDNRLIDATILYGIKRDLEIERKWDGSFPVKIDQNNTMSPFANIDGFQPLGTIATDSKRGLRLKQADFFLCKLHDCKRLGATPFLKKISKLKGYYVPEDHDEAALLVGKNQFNESTIEELKDRINLALTNPEKNESILTWFHERPDAWFIHKEPPYAEIVFNYYLRNRPRHIYNPSRAYSDNFYGLRFPKGISTYAYLAVMNSTAVCIEILSHARNQGNGLAKIQLFEYRSCYVPNLMILSKEVVDKFHEFGVQLSTNTQSSDEIIQEIDQLIASVYHDSRLEPIALQKYFLKVDNMSRKPKEGYDDVLVDD